MPDLKTVMFPELTVPQAEALLTVLSAVMYSHYPELFEDYPMDASAEEVKLSRLLYTRFLLNLNAKAWTELGEGVARDFRAKIRAFAEGPFAESKGINVEEARKRFLEAVDAYAEAGTGPEVTTVQLLVN